MPHLLHASAIRLIEKLSAPSSSVERADVFLGRNRSIVIETRSVHPFVPILVRIETGSPRRHRRLTTAGGGSRTRSREHSTSTRSSTRLTRLLLSDRVAVVRVDQRLPSRKVVVIRVFVLAIANKVGPFPVRRQVLGVLQVSLSRYRTFLLESGETAPPAVHPRSNTDLPQETRLAGFLVSREFRLVIEINLLFRVNVPVDLFQEVQRLEVLSVTQFHSAPIRQALVHLLEQLAQAVHLDLREPFSLAVTLLIEPVPNLIHLQNGRTVVHKNWSRVDNRRRCQRGLSLLNRGHRGCRLEGHRQRGRQLNRPSQIRMALSLVLRILGALSLLVPGPVAVVAERAIRLATALTLAFLFLLLAAAPTAARFAATA